jgi:hypothetical protein
MKNLFKLFIAVLVMVSCSMARITIGLDLSVNNSSVTSYDSSGEESGSYDGSSFTISPNIGIRSNGKIIEFVPYAGFTYARNSSSISVSEDIYLKSYSHYYGCGFMIHLFENKIADISVGPDIALRFNGEPVYTDEAGNEEASMYNSYVDMDIPFSIPLRIDVKAGELLRFRITSKIYQLNLSIHSDETDFSAKETEIGVSSTFTTILSPSFGLAVSFER